MKATNPNATTNAKTNPETVNPFATLLTAYADAVAEKQNYENPDNPYNPKNHKSKYPYTTKTGFYMTYETALKHWKMGNEDCEENYNKALTDLSKAVAYSVLKKCIETSQNPTLIKTRQSIARDLADLDRIAYATANAYETTYTASGDERRTVKNKDLDKALTDLCKSSFGDGIDLVHDAILAILTETAKQTDRQKQRISENNNVISNNCNELKSIHGHRRHKIIHGIIYKRMHENKLFSDKPTDLERPYTERRLKKKVWIKTADSVNGWETVQTTPIQEIYKAVRRSIQNNRSLQTDPRNGYIYIEDISTDPETDIDTVIYRRFGKYADIGGYATDTNGKETFYTADPETAKDLDVLIDSLQLTDRQAKVLSLRQSGYGYDAIHTYLGISTGNVYNVIKAIQKKATAKGLTPTK